MFSFNLVRWVKGMWRRRRGSTIVNKKPRYRLALEELETRLSPAGLTFIWTGAGGNSNWSTAANWSAVPAGTAPSATSILDNYVFGSAGAGATTTNNNVPGLIVNSIQVSGVTAATGGYNITGNLITLGDPSTPGSGSIIVGANLPVENIGLDIQLAATSGSQQFFTINSGTTLNYTGRLSGRTGSQLTKEGTGTLNLRSEEH